MTYLPLTAALLCLTCVAASAQEADHAPLALSLVNEARAEHDLDALEITDTLSEAARTHAEDMLARSYYSHSSPEGDTVQDRVIRAGGSRWQLVAENIARCQGCAAADAKRVRAFQEGWMNSPGHRENILTAGLDGFGFAMAASEEVIYAVQVFGGPGTPLGAEAGADAEAAGPKEVQAAARDGLGDVQMSAGLSAAAHTIARAVEIVDGSL